MSWTVAPPKETSARNLRMRPYLQKGFFLQMLLSYRSWDETILDSSVGCKYKWQVFFKRQKRRGHREDHVEVEPETGVMQPQAKEHQEPPEAGRGKEGFSPRALEMSVALWTPWFRTSGLHAWEIMECVILSCPVCSNLLWQTPEINTLWFWVTIVIWSTRIWLVMWDLFRTL